MNRSIAYAALSALGAVCAVVASAPVDRAPGAPSAGEMAFCFEGPHLSALFAPGTPMETVNKVTRAIMGDGSSRFSANSRWPGALNAPVTLAYSFPSDGLSIPSGVGEGVGLNTLHATFTARFGSFDAGRLKIRQVFDAWEVHTGNVYVEVADDDAPMFGSPGPLHGGVGRGDIRIVTKNLGAPSGVLAYNFFPGSGGGDMVLDDNEAWNSPALDFRFFRNTVAHEHGHGKGLNHVCPAVGLKLMEPFLNLSFDGPQHDDIRGAQFHYGDNFEPNNTAPSAGFLGSFSEDGSVSEVNLSLRDTADDDFFSFTVSGDASVDVTVSPVGAIYENNGQDQACAPLGNPFDSTIRLGLRLRVLDQDGVTVLATADATGLGGSETLAALDLAPAGTYYVQVDDSAGAGSAQIYNLDLAVTLAPPPACPADVNDDLLVDTADLGLVIDAFGDVGAGLPEDLNGDGVVDTADLGLLIDAFGDVCV